MRVALGLKTNRGFEAPTAMALMDLARLLTAKGIEYSSICHFGDCDLSRGTNAVLRECLSTKAGRFLLLDSDNVWTPEDALKLIESEEDYVGANYPRKEIGGGWTASFDPYGRWKGKLQEALVIGNGLLALSRRAVERMAAASEWYVDHGGQLTAAIAKPGPSDTGGWLLDDESMCRRWQSLGGIVWCDTSIRCDHVGTLTFSAKTA